jgi:hypothetical protein
MEVWGLFGAAATAPPKCAQTIHVSVRRLAVEKPDHRHRRLLRMSRERPRGCRAAKERDELAPLHHSITSSARASRAVVRQGCLTLIKHFSTLPWL